MRIRQGLASIDTNTTQGFIVTRYADTVSSYIFCLLPIAVVAVLDLQGNYKRGG